MGNLCSLFCQESLGETKKRRKDLVFKVQTKELFRNLDPSLRPALPDKEALQTG